MTPYWCQNDVLDAEVRSLLAERLDLAVDVVVPAARMIDLGVSYGMWLELALAVEEAFDVELFESDLRRARTVGDWVAMVGRATADECRTGRRSFLPALEELPPPSELPPSSELFAPESVL
jgi:acyl carrier protein